MIDDMRERFSMVALDTPNQLGPVDACGLQQVRMVLRGSGGPTALLCLFWSERESCAGTNLEEMHRCPAVVREPQLALRGLSLTQFIYLN